MTDYLCVIVCEICFTGMQEVHISAMSTKEELTIFYKPAFLPCKRFFFFYYYYSLIYLLLHAYLKIFQKRAMAIC